MEGRVEAQADIARRMEGTCERLDSFRPAADLYGKTRDAIDAIPGADVAKDWIGGVATSVSPDLIVPGSGIAINMAKEAADIAQEVNDLCVSLGGSR